MKLQIENQQLRLRVDEAELARLLGGDCVEMQTHFARAFSITFALRLTQSAEAAMIGLPDAWRIDVPHAAVMAHAERLPTREGLRFLLPSEGDIQALTILFDVDVRDSARRRKLS